MSPQPARSDNKKMKSRLVVVTLSGKFHNGHQLDNFLKSYSYTGWPKKTERHTSGNVGI